MKSRFAAACAVALSAAVIALMATPASAHAGLESTDPAAGAELTEPPTQVTLTFSEEISDLGAMIEITCEQGGDHATGDVVVDGTTVSRGFDFADMPGAFTVTWRVVSADGHPISGSYDFAVRPDGATSMRPPASPSTAASSPPGTAAAEPTTSETPTATPAPAAASGNGMVGWIVAGVVAVAAVAGLLAQRASYRRRLAAVADQHDHSDTGGTTGT